MQVRELRRANQGREGQGGLSAKPGTGEQAPGAGETEWKRGVSSKTFLKKDLDHRTLTVPDLG